MLSYRHAFHAGNYADVLKHLVVCRILHYLVKKPAPVRYIDTHGGAGVYRLDSPEAGMTAEYRNGIGMLWGRKDLPVALAAYCELVAKCNAGDDLRRYPGSPWFARQVLRRQDRLDVCELHPRDFPRLQQLFEDDRRVCCYFEDGFRRSLALIPPLERRALVLIDPSYEIKHDYTRVVAHVQTLHTRFATGIYALWYPLVECQRVKALEAAFINSGMRRIHLYEVGITPNHHGRRMTGAGMIVVNPPWILKEEVRAAIEYFSPLISETREPIYRIVELVGE